MSTQINSTPLAPVSLAAGEKRKNVAASPISGSPESDGADSPTFNNTLSQMMQSNSSVSSTAEPQNTEEELVALHNNAEEVSDTEILNEQNQQWLHALLDIVPSSKPANVLVTLSSAMEQVNSSTSNETQLLVPVKSQDEEQSTRNLTSDLMMNVLAAKPMITTSESSVITLQPGSNNPSIVNTEQNLKMANTHLTLAKDQNQWSEQLRTLLGERLQLQIDKHVQQATIRLDPPEMGKIDISVSFDAGKLQIHINASQGDIYRALQQSSNELRQNLIALHTSQVDVQIFSGDKQQQKKQETTPGSKIIAAEIINSEEETSADDGTLLATV